MFHNGFEWNFRLLAPSTSVVEIFWSSESAARRTRMKNICGRLSWIIFLYRCRSIGYSLLQFCLSKGTKNQHMYHAFQVILSKHRKSIVSLGWWSPHQPSRTVLWLPPTDGNLAYIAGFCLQSLHISMSISPTMPSKFINNTWTTKAWSWLTPQSEPLHQSSNRRVVSSRLHQQFQPLEYLK